jgi:STE24 endopeptidase
MLIKGTPLLTIIILLFIVFDFILDLILDALNAKSWDKGIPAELADLYDPEKYSKAKSYHKAREKLSLVSKAFSTLLIVAILLLKGFALAHIFIAGVTSSPVLQALLFFAGFAVASDIISLPFQLYGIFVIEEKFGFNKMTLKTFLADKLKGFILGGIIGGVLLSLFVWFYTIAGSLFWLYAWMLFAAFALFFATFYTSLIVPLFNKLKPLESGPLREKIESFAQKISFPLTNIFVMDGSKRNTKANAYFSGLGNKKTVVLFDTLIREQSEEELVSVLAHEVGHYKLKHIQKGMVISILQMGVLLFVLSLFINRPELSQAVGLNTETPVFHLGLVAFSLLYSPLSMLTGIFMHMDSRKNEFEADDYAKRHTGTGEHLISALKKLSSSNLSNLNPDKWYVFFHYSHPPLLERVRNLQK